MNFVPIILIFTGAILAQALAIFLVITVFRKKARKEADEAEKT